MVVFAIRALPAEAYPDVAPPQVSINATYPGANADTVERTVIQIIEQQLTGIDNLMYFTSSSSNGGGSITLYFETGTNPDVAAVQTQNRVTLAEPRLPREVVLQGLQVAKVNSGFLMAVEPAFARTTACLRTCSTTSSPRRCSTPSSAFRAWARRSSSAPNIRCASG